METVAAADYRDLALPSAPRVAPDGESVAFVRTTPDSDEEYESTVYVVPVGGGEPQRYTISEGVDAEPRWSPSGDRLAFTSTRGAGDDRQQLWVLPTDGGEARRVTNVAGGVSEIAWSPDGDRIAFVQRVSDDDREEGRDLNVPEDYEPDAPDPRVIDRTVYRSAERYHDGARAQIYLVDLNGDDVARLTAADTDHASPSWGDADTLYYARRAGDDPDDSVEYEIVARDVSAVDPTADDGDAVASEGSDGDAEILHETSGWGMEVAATADGRVAFRYQDPDRTSMQPTELKVFDRGDGSVAHPTATLDRTLGAGATIQWGPDEELLYFTAPDEGRVPLWSAPWDGSEAPTRVIDEGHLGGAHVGEDVLAYVQSEWDHPGDVFAASRGGAERTRLTRLNSDYLDERAIAQPEEVRFETEGSGPTPAVEDADGENGDADETVQGWVLTPPEFGGPEQDGGDETYPLAVEVHGGPHAMWSTAGTMWHEFQTLAARGYVVFWCNPRGSTGYGEEYMQAIERDWGDVTMTDVMAGAREVADRDYVDETNAFLTGGSFGGYMTSWIVGHTDYFEAAVSQRGVYDLTGFYGSTDQAYQLVEGDFGVTPWEEPEFLWEQSPAAYCDRVDTPTLVLHSDDDYRTPANTAELFYRGLRKHGVDTRLVRYPREGHELSRSGEPGHIVDRVERIARWFDGYSEYHDAPRALDRDEDAGLTAGEDEGGESGDGSDAKTNTDR